MMDEKRCSNCGPVDSGTALYCVRCWEPASAEKEIESLQAENDSLWETLVKVGDFLAIDSERARTIPGKPSRVFMSEILRKQAEAVEVLAQRLQEAADKADEGPDESDTACTLIIAKSVALKESQRLRQRADEIERGGTS